MGSFEATKRGVSMSKASRESSSSESSSSKSFAQSLAAGATQVGGQCGMFNLLSWIWMYHWETF